MDADGANKLSDHSSMSSYIYQLADEAISWSLKKQSSIALSSMEAKYIAGAHCYVYGLCLPLRTYLLTDKWVIVRKHLRTSLGTPLCILFRLLLTCWHFLMLLGMCTVHGTLLTEGSASAGALDSCMVQETSMADGSTSEALQTCVLYSVLYMETHFTLYCTWRCHIGHTCI